MDISSLQALVPVLSEKLSGARVAKIHQPGAELLVLRLWNGRENLKLLLSAAAQDCRIALSDEAFANPFAPPRFCQLLRARVTRILSIEQINEDRIVRLGCSGPKGECNLFVELFGRNSNLILVAADGKIIDALKRSREEQGRCIKAGQSYQLPEKHKFPTPLTGVSPVDKGEPAGSVPVDLTSRLRRIVQREKKKLQKRLGNIELEHAKQRQFDRYRQWGELILNDLRNIKKGQSEVELLNYYLSPAATEKIQLDPQRSPQENAEVYFRKYKKSRRGIEHSQRRLDETRSELEWLQQIEFQLEGAAPAVVAETAEELRSAGLLKEATARLPKASGGISKAAYSETISPGGFKLLWGGSSRQNDLLSTKMLKKGDLWFHAHGYPGAHVVLKAAAERGDFPAGDVLYAAALAAANSKAKNAAKVEVMVAEAGAVKKPSGAKPGMVMVRQYKTLLVRPLNGVAVEK